MKLRNLIDLIKSKYHYLGVMKNILILVGVLLLSYSTWAQSSKGDLKKKYLGFYEGKMNGYYLSDGLATVPVDESKCRVVLQPNKLTFALDDQAKSGSYSVLMQTKEYAVLEVTYENDPIRDRFVLPKKGKILNREGLTPQPNVTLNKVKK